MSRLDATVVDAETGEELDGVPDHLLFMLHDGKTMNARHRDGCWYWVSPERLDWHRRHGHELRIVRVVEAANG